MKKVRELLQKKSDRILSIRPDASVLDALVLMKQENVGALLVIGSNGLAGIFSERDYARKVVLAGHSSKTTQVREVMASKVVYVAPSETVEECMALMTDKHIRHLPVMEHGRLLGLVSIGDLVKATIAEQQFVIEQLENYITGAPGN